MGDNGSEIFDAYRNLKVIADVELFEVIDFKCDRCL